MTRRKRIPGIASLPGFAESLRLLIESEEYTLEDVGMMFGVTRERIRQLCDRYGISYRCNGGLHCVRVWDDTTHRFRPVRRTAIKRAERERRRAARRAAGAKAQAARQALIVARVTALKAALGREPTWFEMWAAITGTDPMTRPHGQTASWAYAGRVVGMWDTHKRPTREKLRSFREATGTNPRPLGHHGHIPPHPDTQRVGVQQEHAA